MALYSIDESCVTYLNSANPVVCSGTCNTQLAAAITACANEVSLTVVRYNNLGHKTFIIV